MNLNTIQPAEGSKKPRRRVGRGNQQLGRHAAHPRAGRAPGALVDQGKALRVAAHGAQGGQPGRAGADDEYVVIVVMGLVHAATVRAVGGSACRPG